MIDKILVPIAFSKLSKGILEYAAGLAQPLGARLLIANVVNERDLKAVERIASYGYKVDGDHYIATIQKERATLLGEMVEELGIGDADYDYSFVVGDPAEELLQLVVSEKVDMVVMGTKARDLRHMFAGSVAEQMFRKCPVPVTFYRGEEMARELEKKIRKEMDNE